MIEKYFNLFQTAEAYIDAPTFTITYYLNGGQVITNTYSEDEFKQKEGIVKAHFLKRND